jgi:hypothetical protein
MNPPDVRTCTPRELHGFLQTWADQQDSDSHSDWDDGD